MIRNTHEQPNRAEKYLWGEPADAPAAPSRELVPPRSAQRGTPPARSQRRMTAASVARFAAGSLIAFLVASFAVVVLAGAATLALTHTYDGKILPGVHAGTVDLGGLTRDEAVAKLDSAYASLGQGEIVITSPGGRATITYADAGRRADSTAMADAAFDVGRSENPLEGMASALHTVAAGSDVPVMVKLDPPALAAKIREATKVTRLSPKDASVVIDGADSRAIPAVAGSGIDELAVAAQIIDRLVVAERSAELQIDARIVATEPVISDADAQAAVASAARMSVPVTLVFGDKSWTIDAATIHSWIQFTIGPNGKYGPAVDPAPLTTFVGNLAAGVKTDPIEPTVIYVAGQPNALSASQPGKALDVDGTVRAVQKYLDELGSGVSVTQAPLMIVVADVQPTIGTNPVVSPAWFASDSGPLPTSPGSPTATARTSRSRPRSSTEW